MIRGAKTAQVGTHLSGQVHQAVFNKFNLIYGIWRLQKPRVWPPAEPDVHPSKVVAYHYHTNQRPIDY